MGKSEGRDRGREGGGGWVCGVTKCSRGTGGGGSGMPACRCLGRRAEQKGSRGLMDERLVTTGNVPKRLSTASWVICRYLSIIGYRKHFPYVSAACFGGRCVVVH